jgi:hypothetical protein
MLHKDPLEKDKRAQIFRAWHGGKSKAEMIVGLRDYTRPFPALVISLLGTCIAAVTLSALQLRLVREGGSPDVLTLLTLVASSLLGLACFGALYGNARLKADLAADGDGKETWAQTWLELFFWGAIYLCALLTFAGIAILANEASPSSGVRDELQTTASLFPHTFEHIAHAADVDATPNTGSVSKVHAVAQRLRIALASVCLLVVLVALPTQYVVVKLVTPYEIVQGLLRNLILLGMAAALAILVGAILGLVFLSQLAVSGASLARHPRCSHGAHTAGHVFCHTLQIHCIHCCSVHTDGR